MGISGKHVAWKTRGLVGNTGSQWKTWGQSLKKKHGGTIFSPNNEFSSSSYKKSNFCYFILQWKSFGAKRVFQ